MEFDAAIGRWILFVGGHVFPLDLRLRHLEDFVEIASVLVRPFLLTFRQDFVAIRGLVLVHLEQSNLRARFVPADYVSILLDGFNANLRPPSTLLPNAHYEGSISSLSGGPRVLDLL